MSEYFLADIRADERARLRDQQRELEQKQPEARQSQEMKVTLLGDFLLQSAETQGFDPYNATNGKSAREVWKNRHNRR
jgi:hypothetical protein